MKEETKRFDTPEGCELLVESGKGKITVKGWDRPETEVTAVQHQEWSHVEIHQTGRQVVARTEEDGHPHRRSGGHSAGRGTPVVDYTVRVPHSSNLELKGVEGSIQVDHVQGTLDLHTVSGSTTLQDLGGQIGAVAVNGSIHAVRLEGSAKLETVNGSIEVEDSQLETLKTETVNGRITVQVSPNASGYALNTVNGGCHLVLPPDLSARVSVRGVNVKVDCNVLATSVKRSLGVWKGVLGNGSGPTANVTVTAVNGRLRIDSTEADEESGAEFVAKAAASPVAPAEAPKAEPEQPTVTEAPPRDDAAEETPKGSTQAEILKRVESGEISVQDALSLLEGARA